MRCEDLGFPQPDRIMTGKPESFLNYHPVMAATANGGDGFENALEPIGGDAHFGLGAEPGIVFSSLGGGLLSDFGPTDKRLALTPALSPRRGRIAGSRR